jgi:hypothetical protein
MIGGSLAVQKAAGGGTQVVCTVDISGKGGRPQPGKIILNQERVKRD